jgi:5-hydroxyisourate hydrolase
MSLSTHVLDTARGRPAAGVRVRLERLDTAWVPVADGVTDDDGRLRDWVGPAAAFGPGEYRLIFDTAAYFTGQGLEAFFPEVTVAFAVTDDSDHHVPLLLSPFAYSTYRGS